MHFLIRTSKTLVRLGLDYSCFLLSKHCFLLALSIDYTILDIRAIGIVPTPIKNCSNSVLDAAPQ